MVIDPDYLERLRAEAAEVRADLEEREANECASALFRSDSRARRHHGGDATGCPTWGIPRDNP